MIQNNFNIPEFQSEDELINWAKQNLGQSLTIYNITQVFPKIKFDENMTPLNLLCFNGAEDEKAYEWYDAQAFDLLDIHVYKTIGFDENE